MADRDQGSSLRLVPTRPVAGDGAPGWVARKLTRVEEPLAAGTGRCVLLRRCLRSAWQRSTAHNGAQGSVVLRFKRIGAGVVPGAAASYDLDNPPP